MTNGELALIFLIITILFSIKFLSLSNQGKDGKAQFMVVITLIPFSCFLWNFIYWLFP